MRDACFREFCPVVLCFIQTDYVSHTEVLKHLKVVFWRISAAVLTNLVDWAHECYVLARNNPV
jgi:hypothetical protein